MRKSERERTAVLKSALGMVTGLLFSGLVFAGGTPENILLIIDPTDADSMYVGNYYRQARGIPAANVIYLSADSGKYDNFVNDQIPAFLGTLENRDLWDHIDYVVVAPGAPYRISASGFISDGCATVNNFAVSSVYSMAFLTDQILSGWQSTARNGYADTTGNPALGFDSEITWWKGEPSDDPSAHRMFIGALLGYTGDLGNTVPEIIAMIDRSVAVDGTFPTGTFYFMETTDQARSGPRHNFFDRAVDLIEQEGGTAEHRCCDALPLGSDDCFGIMTGKATPGIDGADLTILPGAFCDHLTSFAGNFKNTSQEKMSRWIAEGASGSWGTVEEPCNYPQKFPHAFTHVQYLRGMSLGEAVMRNIGFVPFQGLLLGDPMTRPFTHIPSVEMINLPVNPVSGIVALTPAATTTHPTAKIASYDLLVDGVLWENVRAGKLFSLDTTRFDDGTHELRVIAYDDTDLNSAGRWQGMLPIDNDGYAAVIDQISPLAGDLATAFEVTFSIESNGASVLEVRLHQNGRVVAATLDPNQPITVHGRMLGAGLSSLHVEALLSDGSVVPSGTIEIDVSRNLGSPLGAAPIAFDYTKTAITGETIIVELPTTADDPDRILTYEIISGPAQAFIHPVKSAALPYRIVTVDTSATGFDEITFEVSDGINKSNLATVQLNYQACNFGNLLLTVGPLVTGQIGEFTVTCGYPNDPTFLVYSLQGFGSTPVPALNITLELRQPKQAGKMKISDAEGTAVWSLPIPNIKTPRRIFLQAAQRSATSPAFFTEITN